VARPAGPDEAPAAAGTVGPVPGGRRISLASHLDRTIARLTGAQAAATGTPLAEIFAGVVAELDRLRNESRRARGEARAAVTERLRTLDGMLMTAVRGATGPDLLATCRREAEAELAPFRARMPDAAFQKALTASTDRLLRERLQIPHLIFDSL
jgi:hypothetical protein